MSISAAPTATATAQAPCQVAAAWRSAALKAPPDMGGRGTGLAANGRSMLRGSPILTRPFRTGARARTPEATTVNSLPTGNRMVRPPPVTWG